MVALKAFIGHSFSSDDEAVVRAFLKIFDEIKEMDIGFSWQHAEAAEAKELADKVLRLMQDKNLFIGICTKNEEAVLSENLKPTFFGNNRMASAESFKSKTSDWIIQEIGLAIGKGMDVILLVESGLRPPGGLQGNKEYIVFDRAYPEKVFVKISEMIRSLIPKTTAVTRIEAEVRTAPEEKSTEPSQDKDWLKPKPDWKREDFERALRDSILLDVKDSEQAIDQAYLETEDGKESYKRESWKAYHELLLLRWGKGGQLTKLDQFAVDHPDNADVLMYRAQGYQRYGEHEKAAQHFEAAAQKAQSPLDKLHRYGDAAIALVKATRREQAHRLIDQIKSMAPAVENGELTLLYTLRAIAEIEKANDDFCSLTEKILDFHPADIYLRFELAYKYSEKGAEDLSLYHYLKIPYQERTPITWNNLGVQFEHFELASKSVNAYRMSEEHEETLAMSNLAQRFTNAGFLEEAEEICNRAMKIKGYHKNVGSTISRIKSVPEAEEKKVEEIQQKAVLISEFFKNYGHALAQETVGEYQGRWQGSECELSIAIKGNSFEAEGSFERTSYNSLAGLLIGKPESSPKKTRYLVKYEGTIHGKAVEAIYKQINEDDPPKSQSLLGLAVDPGKSVLMVISDFFEEIQIYEKAEKDNKLYKFTRLS